MNLKYNIKRILREEVEIPSFIKRRFDFDDILEKFNESLSLASSKFIEKKAKLNAMTAEKFVHVVTSDLINKLCKKDTSDFCLENFDEMWGFLGDYFQGRISKRFYEIKFGEETLSESTKPLKAMRRTNLIDDEITRLLDKVYKGKKICELYDDEDMFVRVVTEAVVENLYFNTFYMMDDTSEEWEKSVDFIYEYVKDSHRKTLTDYYKKHCNKRVETNEGELTEKCWPGYTQKGMKTMFGKKYPNCVKKTKKKVNEHKETALMEVNDRTKKLIQKYVNENGLYKASRMLGITMTKIVEISNIPIDSEAANELLLENMRLKNLKRGYEQFNIRPSGDGIFYWEAGTNTGHFLPDMMESISVVATPFWDGNEWTPVELDWYTLLNGDGKAIIEVSSDGSYYRQLKHQTHFNSVKELFNWYEEYYLPTVYDVIMNEILPNVHQHVDDELDNRGGYK